MKTTTITKLALSLALGFAGAAQASTVTFDSIGDASTLHFNATVDGATLDTSFAFTLTSLTASTVQFAVHALNNSSGPGQNVFMSMGIDVVSPALTGATASDIWSAGLKVVLPGSQKVDLCVYAAQNCAGGAIGQGLAEGGTSDFTLTLTTAGSFLTSGVSFLSPYSAKWQGVGLSGDSYETASGCFGNNCGGGGTETSVPEPMSLALVGIVLLGAAAARR
ncbi:MAG: cistern family PEP-CTERM protein, partial [Rubrivivax sp.]